MMLKTEIEPSSHMTGVLKHRKKFRETHSRKARRDSIHQLKEQFLPQVLRNYAACQYLGFRHWPQICEK